MDLESGEKQRHAIEKALELEQARFSFQQAHLVQMMHLSQQSTEVSILNSRLDRARTRPPARSFAPDALTLTRAPARRPARQEYNSLVQDYYLLRVQHQNDMLRLNQVLYLSQTAPEQQQDQPTDVNMVVTDTTDARPALAGINANMQLDNVNVSRKRTASAVLGGAEGENKAARTAN